jgi:hypothetical protein
MPPNFREASNIAKSAAIETWNLPMGNALKYSKYLGHYKCSFLKLYVD